MAFNQSQIKSLLAVANLEAREAKTILSGMSHEDIVLSRIFRKTQEIIADLHSFAVTKSGAQAKMDEMAREGQKLMLLAGNIVSANEKMIKREFALVTELFAAEVRSIRGY
ncbi:MAG: hypothetical protein HYT16_03570 [DPANN group archaeon]|nr:hypothetical protein [DPANN group archaeon]